MSASVVVPQSGLDGVVKPQEPVQPEALTGFQYAQGTIRGDVTQERKYAISESYDYLKNLGFSDYLSGEIEGLVYLDQGLEKNVLGKTECGISEEDVYCRVLLKPEIYDKPFTKMKEGSPEHIAAKYHQVHTLAHEIHHKDFLESQKGMDVVNALEELGYAQSEIAGVIEMVTEKELIDMYAETGAEDMAFMARRNTPYRKQLERAYRIEDLFDGGMNGFLQALAGNDVDKKELDTYMAGIGVPIHKGMSYRMCICSK